jgi:hypothetical protein
VADEIHGFTRYLGQFTIELILTHEVSPKKYGPLVTNTSGRK